MVKIPVCTSWAGSPPIASHTFPKNFIKIPSTIILLVILRADREVYKHIRDKIAQKHNIPLADVIILTAEGTLYVRLHRGKTDRMLRKDLSSKFYGAAHWSREVFWRACKWRD